MTSILSIETAGVCCSVALNCDGEVTELVERAPREHARKILFMVDQILSDSGLSLKQLDALAFTQGPGSFTGLRIGFGVVQGLAFGADLPVIGLSTLKVMAFKAAVQRKLSAGRILTAIDARMNEIYWAVYEAEVDAELVVVLPDCAAAPEDILAAIRFPLVAAVGDGCGILAQFSSSMTVSEKHPDWSSVWQDDDFFADARHLSLLAMPAYLRGETVAIDDAHIAYIRNEISWKKRKRIRSADSV
ncbi:MAG: tRNA (adenosine(37)-N6)-threonylcarbamoyltransferase complex dimerization subunit type 1 TsaB [Porticoccaceae bacterium]|nr:tRNA (adenosine(37)-N6)-threonylcarbamoyltransferase complex dimerization subunit type 1 TsaB [Porticoccaceae bacterium]